MTKRKEIDKCKEEGGIVEQFLGRIPLLGDLVEELGKTETFKEKFKEANEKIEENLRMGKKKKWGFEAVISVRQILNEPKEEPTNLVIKENYCYCIKNNELLVALKSPKKEVALKLDGKTLIAEAEGFQKKILLPGYYTNIETIKYQNEILLLKLTK